MNECDKIHPRLPDYLRDKLSMVERRWVARHLNLCAAARRELDEYKTGARKPPPERPALPALPWDQKILAWITRNAGVEAPAPPVLEEPIPEAPVPAKKKVGLIGMLVMAVLVVPVTPLLLLLPQSVWDPILRVPVVQTEIQSVKALVVEARTGWLHQSPEQAGWKASQAPHWEGVTGPVAEAQQDCVTIEQDFEAYWQLLRPGTDEPDVNFNREAVVILFQGQKKTTGFGIGLTKLEDRGASLVVHYQEKEPGPFSLVKSQVNRPWFMMVIPRPAKPVVFQRD
ncbi:MAG TPA: zf-HC2 domain-containing protein [bacterium]|nr:zf-HC2 domain-containing protein [bacterium]